MLGRLKVGLSAGAHVMLVARYLAGLLLLVHVLQHLNGCQQALILNTLMKNKICAVYYNVAPYELIAGRNIRENTRPSVNGSLLLPSIYSLVWTLVAVFFRLILHE